MISSSRPALPAGSGAAVSIPAAAMGGVINSAHNVWLPKLDLPKLTGKYEDWFPFYEMFNSVINDNRSLTERLSEVTILEGIDNGRSGKRNRVVRALRAELSDGLESVNQAIQ